MAVKDWGANERWLLATIDRRWNLFPPMGSGQGVKRFATFAEAHAAYLEAVMCPQRTPFLSYTTPTCMRARGHEGPHRFWSKNGRTPLEVMPK